MLVAGTSLNNLAGAVGRGIMRVGAKVCSFDTGVENDAITMRPDENVPEVEFQRDSIFDRTEKLRESERLERQTMVMIRSSLYPVAGPRADSNT